MMPSSIASAAVPCHLPGERYPTTAMAGIFYVKKKAGEGDFDRRSTFSEREKIKQLDEEDS
jgi:hypothetical protein